MDVEKGEDVEKAALVDNTQPDQEAEPQGQWTRDSTAETLHLSFGAFSLQGARKTMEDMHTTIPASKFEATYDAPKEFTPPSFFAVYDGHGGDSCAKYSAKYVPNKLAKDGQYGVDYPKALTCAIQETDKAFIEACTRQNLTHSSGTTACMALIDHEKFIMHVANVGDSRCVISTNNKARTVTIDHKPSNEGEKQRILAAGGKVAVSTKFHSPQEVLMYLCGCCCSPPMRVYPGGLSVSRTLGDIGCKKDGARLVVCDPDIFSHRLTKNDNFFIIACDGLWDVMTSESAVNFVRKNANQTAQKLAEMLCRRAIYLGSTDNVTAVVVVFDWS